MHQDCTRGLSRAYAIEQTCHNFGQIYPFLTYTDKSYLVYYLRVT